MCLELDCVAKKGKFVGKLHSWGCLNQWYWLARDKGELGGVFEEL